MRNAVLVSFFLLLSLTHSGLAQKMSKESMDSSSNSGAPVRPHGYSVESADKETRLNVSFYTQGRMTYREQEANSTNRLFWSLAKTRGLFTGSMLTQDFTYEFELEVMNPSFIDVYGNYHFNDRINTKFGLFKVPFNRQFMTDSSEFVFADNYNYRAVNVVYLARDVGFNLHGLLLDNVLKYNLYVFNGNGVTGTLNTDTNLEPTVGLRVDGTVLGKNPGFIEEDWARSTSPNLVLGAAAALDTGSSIAGATNNTIFMFTVDALYQYKGFSALPSFYFAHNKTSTGNNPGSDQDLGFEGLMSYFIIPNKCLLAVRGAGIMRQDNGAFATGGRNIYEAGAALNYWFYKRNVKMVLDYTAELYQAQADNVNHTLRTQVQLWL